MKSLSTYEAEYNIFSLREFGKGFITWESAQICGLSSSLQFTIILPESESNTYEDMLFLKFKVNRNMSYQYNAQRDNFIFSSILLENRSGDNNTGSYVSWDNNLVFFYNSI